MPSGRKPSGSAGLPGPRAGWDWIAGPAGRASAAHPCPPAPLSPSAIAHARPSRPPCATLAGGFGPPLFPLRLSLPPSFYYIHRFGPGAAPRGRSGRAGVARPRFPGTARPPGEPSLTHPARSVTRSVTWSVMRTHTRSAAVGGPARSDPCPGPARSVARPGRRRRRRSQQRLGAVGGSLFGRRFRCRCTREVSQRGRERLEEEEESRGSGVERAADEGASAEAVTCARGVGGCPNRPLQLQRLVSV